MAKNGRYMKDELEFARAVTFFDAIFAFAVTLLITTVDNFEPETWSSLSKLWEKNGSSLLAFTISFVVVVSFWRANHQQVTGFLALDGQLITLNCAVMFGVVLIPFTTEAMGKLENLPLPVAIYAVNISAVYIMQFVVGFVADRRGMRSETKMTTKQVRWELVDAAVLPLVFLGSIPVAYFIGPDVAQKSWLLLLVVMPLVGTVQTRIQRSENLDAAAEPPPPSN